MADNKQSVNEHPLASFSSITVYEQRAVRLKSEGVTNAAIAGHLKAEFALDYSEWTVKDWFNAGGRLEQAYLEYNEALAAASLRDAKQLLRRASKTAAARLIQKMDSHDERVALDATKSVLNKFVPDRQVMLAGDAPNDDLPPELAEAGDKLMEEPDNGSEPVDDAPEGDSAGASPGDSGGEAVS